MIKNRLLTLMLALILTLLLILLVYSSSLAAPKAPQSFNTTILSPVEELVYYHRYERIPYGNCYVMKVRGFYYVSLDVWIADILKFQNGNWVFQENHAFYSIGDEWLESSTQPYIKLISGEGYYHTWSIISIDPYKSLSPQYCTNLNIIYLPLSISSGSSMLKMTSSNEYKIINLGVLKPTPTGKPYPSP